MEKISELTSEQLQKASEYRERFFGFATSTKPGNKALASQAAVRLAELGGLKKCEVKFVSNPEEGDSFRNSTWVSLSEPLRNSLKYSIWVSLRNSLKYSIWVSLLDSFRISVSGSLYDSLSESLWVSLYDSLRDSLSESLYDCSLGCSFWDSFWDSGWTAFYSFMAEELGVECSDKHREILSLYREIAENCSAIWITPGTIIICDKPSFVEIKDGNLISVEWNQRGCKRD